MEVKLFEIRDRATFIPVMAVRPLAHPGSQELWLLRRGGLGPADNLMMKDQIPIYIYLSRLDGEEAHLDPFTWRNQRTMTTAHNHILENWNELTSGQVIDVEYVLGEVDKPKESERDSVGL